MAIINCKECGKEISDKARKCPHCGNPQKTAIKSILDVISNNKRKFKFLIIGIILFLIVFLLFRTFVGQTLKWKNIDVEVGKVEALFSLGVPEITGDGEWMFHTAKNKFYDLSINYIVIDFNKNEYIITFENTTSEEEIQKMLFRYCDYEYDKGDDMMVFSYDDLIIEHYYDWSNIYIKRK